MILQYLPTLLNGLGISLSLMCCSLLLAVLLALLMTRILLLRVTVLATLTRLFITLFTGTPLLVQIFLIYYGPGQFACIRQSPQLWAILSQPWLCAMLALALNSAAYTTQLFYGAARAIPASQWEVCSALGMTSKQAVTLLLPYALKRALPAWSNEVILIFKSTSLAYTVTLMDVMGQSQWLYGQNWDANVFLAAGLIYLSINGLLTLALRCLERKVLVFEKKR